MFGSFLMIVGANLAVGSAAVAFYLASFGCAMGAADGQCGEGAFRLFIDLMSSGSGIVFWIVIAAGLALVWWGRRIRRRP